MTSTFLSAFDFLAHRPLLMLVLLAIPLLLMARFNHVYPRQRLLYWTLVPAIISVSMVLHPVIGWYVLAMDAAIIALATIDYFSIVSAKNFAANRQVLMIASLGKPHDVEVELTNRSQRNCRVRVCDDLPQSFTAEPSAVNSQLSGPGKVVYRYRCIAHQRGREQMDCVHVRIDSRWKLWHAYYKIPCVSIVNVYPDLKQISEYDLLARTNRLSMLGVRRSRKIGQDNEFERLRDYTQDDNYKHIDWRTTARRRKLTVRDYQANQSQRIMFLVDCGRMMTGRSQNMTMLDHAFNAMLMLGYVALRQGDSVGMLTFSDRIHHHVPARSGVNHINRLLHGFYDQQASYVESRYDEAFLHLRANCRKRSLVILITNVIDDINSFQIRQYLGNLAGLHLPLAVLLKDHDLYKAIDEAEDEFATDASIYRGAAAVDVVTWRQQVIRDLQHQGALTLDAFPEQLTTRMVNQYLEIKARHLL